MCKQKVIHIIISMMVLIILMEHSIHWKCLSTQNSVYIKKKKNYIQLKSFVNHARQKSINETISYQNKMILTFPFFQKALADFPQSG